MPHHVAILLLAAGGSSRFGSPKQLIPYKGTTLVRHLAQVALQSKVTSVTVVLGADAKRIEADLSGLPVNIVYNTHWEEGISSSIRVGIKSLPKTADAVLMMLCDQPLVTAELLDLIIEQHAATGKPIITSEYSNTRGVPALFAKSLFPELTKLSGDTGAKIVIQRHPNDVEPVSFPNGAVDIDTPENLS